MKSHGWQRFEDMQLPGMAAKVQVWKKGDCGLLLGHEDRHGDGVKRLHLSISCQHRYPTWDEIKDARYSLLPLGMTFAMLLPPPGEYVNVHPNCFHLWEIDDK